MNSLLKTTCLLTHHNEYHNLLMYLISEFGDDSLMVLTDHYHSILENANIDIGESISEWSSLKQNIYERYLVLLYCYNSEIQLFYILGIIYFYN